MRTGAGARSRPFPLSEATARSLLRLVATAAILGLLLTATIAKPAAAHALLLYADPPPGASLATPPSRIVLTFGEVPDPALSFVSVAALSSAAGTPDHVRASGRAALISGAPTRLWFALPKLAVGNYRVVWRVVSAADGAATSGSYAFAIGVPVTGGVTAEETAIPFVPAAVAARWLFYLGLFVLVGAAFVITVIYGQTFGWALPLSAAGFALAATGLVWIVALQAIDAHASIPQLFPTVIGRAAAVRAVPLLVTGVVVATQWRRQKPTVDGAGVIGIAAAAALLGDSAASHAAAIGLAHPGGHQHFDVIVQWLHLTAAGVWLGGLLAVLVSLRGRRGGDVKVPLRRFATAAMLALIVVALTGTLRAAAELQSVGDLLATDFGRLLLAKSALLTVLAGLGAVNHFRNVPAAAGGLGPLRRIGSLELTFAAMILVLAASLASVSPPQHIAAVPGREATTPSSR